MSETFRHEDHLSVVSMNADGARAFAEALIGRPLPCARVVDVGPAEGPGKALLKYKDGARTYHVYPDGPPKLKSVPR